MIDINEAYISYNKVINGETTLSENSELDDNDVYSGIEHLNHYDLGILAEEIVYHLLDESFELNEIQEQFIESLTESFDYNRSIIMEARVTSSTDRSSPSIRKTKITRNSDAQKDWNDKRAAVKSRNDARRAEAEKAVRDKKAAKRAENIQKLKSTVKNTVSDVKSKFKRGVDSVKSGVNKVSSDVKSRVKDAKVSAHGPLKNYAANRGLHKNITSKAGNPLKSPSQIQTRGQSHRDQLRKAVVKDVGSRIRNKASQLAVGAYNKGREAVNSVKDTAGRAKQSVKNAVSRAQIKPSEGIASKVKKKVKSTVGQAARKVADRLGEDIDLFDYISDFLISEGYADTIEDADYIMANELTEDQIEAIVEADHTATLERVSKLRSKLDKNPKKSKKIMDKITKLGLEGGRTDANENI